MKKILVYRVGHLGDTVASLPSIWAIKDNFPGVRIFLLGQKQFNFRVVPEEIFKNSSLFEGFFFHRIYPGLLGKIMKPFRLLKLLLDLRGEGFDAVVYLPLSDKATNLMRRDRGFFKLVGIN